MYNYPGYLCRGAEVFTLVPNIYILSLMACKKTTPYPLHPSSSASRVVEMMRAEEPVLQPAPSSALRCLLVAMPIFFFFLEGDGGGDR